jgi:hypothetical protein
MLVPVRLEDWMLEMSKWDDDWNAALPKMDPRYILQLAMSKFEPDVARTMTAIALSESFGGAPNAVGDRGGSWGLWQINRSAYQDLVDAGIIEPPPNLTPSDKNLSERKDSKQLWQEHGGPQLTDPVKNLNAAYMLGWHKGASYGPVTNKNFIENNSFDFTHWTKYNNGDYKTYIDDVNALDIPLSNRGRTPGRIGRGEYSEVRRILRDRDPVLARSLSDRKLEGIQSGAIKMIPPQEADALSDNDLAQRGFKRDPVISFLIEPFGMNPREEFADTASWLWDNMKGFLMKGMPEDFNPKSFSTPDEWPTEEIE